MVKHNSHTSWLPNIFSRHIAFKIEAERKKRRQETLLNLYGAMNSSNQPMNIISEESFISNFSFILFLASNTIDITKTATRWYDNRTEQKIILIRRIEPRSSAARTAILPLY